MSKTNHMKNYSKSTNQSHLQLLAIEVYKSLMHLNSGFMRSYFSEKLLPYKLRNGNSLQLPHVKLYLFEIKSLPFRGSTLWNNLPFSVKKSKTLNEFKNKLKTLIKLKTLTLINYIHCTCVVCH